MQKVIVSFLLSYTRFFAKLALQIGKPTVIGITGSAGKSTTRNAMYALLKDSFSTKVIEKGNSETGIPLGILGLEIHSLGFQSPLQSALDWFRLIILCPLSIFSLTGTKYLIVEMGIDEPFPPKNMGYLLTIVKPDISVFLNVYPVHTMQFDVLFKDHPEGETIQERLPKILAAIAKEKGKIITESGCKVAIYNHDNEYIVNELHTFKHSHIDRYFATFGKNTTNDISYTDYVVSSHGTRFSYEIHKDNTVIPFTLEFSKYVLPLENRESFAAVILVGMQVGLSLEQIKIHLQNNLTLPSSRSSMFNGIKNSVIIDSSYNASKVPVISFIDLAYSLKKTEDRPFIFMFGDMRELGEESQHEHEEVAKHMLGRVDELYCIGENTKKYVLPLVKDHLKNVQWFENSVELGAYVREHVQDRSVILAKGSQNTIFLEEAVKQLLENPSDSKYLCRQEPYWLEKKDIKSGN